MMAWVVFFLALPVRVLELFLGFLLAAEQRELFRDGQEPFSAERKRLSWDRKPLPPKGKPDLPGGKLVRPQDSWLALLQGWQAAILLLGGGLAAGLEAAGAPQTGVLAVEIAALAAALAGQRQKALRRCLFLAFFYQVGVALGDFLFTAVLGVVFREPAFFNSCSPAYFVGVWLARLLLVGVAMWFHRCRKEEGAAFRLASMLAVLGLFGAVTLSQQTWMPLDEEQVETWIILAMILLFAVMLYRVERQRELEAEMARLKREQAESLEREYRSLRRVYGENAKLYHDLHHHIEAIYQCLAQGETEAAMGYCEALRGPVREIAQTIWTGDTAVDYLISSKLAQAEEHQIQTDVHVEFPRRTNLRSVDLTAILGNLLDNALEALKTAPENRRFLRLTIRRIQEMLVIKVENGYGKAPVQDKETLQTSKSDKVFHGWGLPSVRSAAERYEGTLVTRYGDGVFQAVVTLGFRPVREQGDGEA